MIEPPAILGILGGGQLGRYFVVAARTMGYRTMVLEPDPLAPAGVVADVHLVAPYDDPAALATMAGQCAVVTTEFENPPASALALLAAATIVRPSAEAIAVTQDRLSEKRFLVGLGSPVAPFAVLDSTADLREHGVEFPAILKTARMGYDGKGQVTVVSDVELAAAWSGLGRVACVLEQRLHLDAEVSIVLARSHNGDVAAFPPVSNTHVNGVLDLTVFPADLSPDVARQAVDLATSIAHALDYVGVLGVEMFVVSGGLVVNELAPRPHNSGHWTLDGARTSQFEQQVRAICGLALGDPTATIPAAAMVNLLGEVWAEGDPDWAAAVADRRAHLHLYGKHEPRPGRKMGHVTVLGDTAAEAAQVALTCRAHARRDV